MEKLKMENKVSLATLFYNLFIINTFTFGGGYTIIPVIKDKFVTELNALDEKDMLDIISLAQSVPGAMAISTSYLLGCKLRGFIGGLVAILASTLPCLIIISLISIAYTKFIENIYIKKSLESIGAMVCAILIVTVYKMFIKMNKKLLFLFVLAFIMSYFYQINIAIILIISAIVGIIYNTFFKKGE